METNCCDYSKWRFVYNCRLAILTCALCWVLLICRLKPTYAIHWKLPTLLLQVVLLTLPLIPGLLQRACLWVDFISLYKLHCQTFYCAVSRFSYLLSELLPSTSKENHMSGYWWKVLNYSLFKCCQLIGCKVGLQVSSLCLDNPTLVPW